MSVSDTPCEFHWQMPFEPVPVTCPPFEAISNPHNVPDNSPVTLKSEAIGKSNSNSVKVDAAAVGSTVTLPLTVTTSPTLIYCQLPGVAAVMFNKFDSVGVYVPLAIDERLRQHIFLDSCRMALSI